VVTTSRERNGKRHAGGGNNWDYWRNDLRRVLQNTTPGIRFTTLLDLYALPGNTPGLLAAASERDTTKRCAALERAIAEDIGDPRLLPYIQRHEFESLVLAALPSLGEVFEKKERDRLNNLIDEIRHLGPEDVNDGPETAPSKRLKGALRSYQKTLHGPSALGRAGIAAIRKQCPRFHAWVEALEQFGTL
jgi:hypothetical protein